MDSIGLRITLDRTGLIGSVAKNETVQTQSSNRRDTMERAAIPNGYDTANAAASVVVVTPPRVTDKYG